VSLLNVTSWFVYEHVSQSLFDTYTWCSSYFTAVRMGLYEGVLISQPDLLPNVVGQNR